jgi:hypothetical protein
MEAAGVNDRDIPSRGAVCGSCDGRRACGVGGASASVHILTGGKKEQQ